MSRSNLTQVQEDIANKTKYGKLTILTPVLNHFTHRRQVMCECDCGNPSALMVDYEKLKQGTTRSCGCTRKDSCTYANQAPSKRAKISDALKGRPSNMLGKRHTLEMRTKMSLARTGKGNPMWGKRGKQCPSYGKPAVHGTGSNILLKSGEEVWIRSTWEEKVIRYLEARDILVKVEPQAFPITYVYEGVTKQGTYRPDLWVPEINVWLEIKGWWRDDAKAKFDAFKEQYPEEIILLYDEGVLKSLGIL